MERSEPSQQGGHLDVIWNRDAIALYDDAGRARGGIEAEDRYGVMRAFPFVTLSIGALHVAPVSGVRIRPEDIASAAARVKHQVKHGNVPLAVEPYLPDGNSG